MSKPIVWSGVDPCFGQMLHGLRKAFDEFPQTISVTPETVGAFRDVHALERAFSMSECLIEKSARQRRVLPWSDVITISNLFVDQPLYGWQHRQMVWMTDDNTNWMTAQGLHASVATAMKRLRWYLQFKPRVLVTEVPMKILREDNPRNFGVSNFRKYLHNLLTSHAYSMTLFETNSSMHGYPDGTFKTFLLAWFSEKSPMLNQVVRTPQTKTLPEFFYHKHGSMSGGVRNLNFQNPYVEYFRTVLNEEPMPSDIESHNLLFRLETRGLAGEFLEWVNTWVTTPEDKAFAREVDAFVYGNSPVNNSPNVLSHISDRTQPGHLRNLLHPFANRFCTPVEVLEMIGIPIPAKTLEVQDPKEACAIIVGRELGRAQTNVWEDIGRLIAGVFNDTKPIYEADSDFYVWDNVAGKRVSMVPKHRKRPRNVPA